MNVIKGVIYSKCDDKIGPFAFSWIPKGLPDDVKSLISMKSISILSGEGGLIPKSLAVLPFPSIHLKALIQCFELEDEASRGGFMDSSISILFDEADDPIFYKYMKNLEPLLREVVVRIKELEASGAERSEITDAISDFHDGASNLLNELRELEISMEKEEVLEMAEEEPGSFKFKIIICGDLAVGKTSTVLRFTDPTMGVNISQKQIRFNKNTRVQFIIWDIAGQTKFMNVRKNFYGGAEGQLLMFDLTRIQTFKNVKTWYMDIRKFLKDDICGFLVGNKADLRSLRKISRDEISILEKELGLEYVEMSALTGENVDEAFQQLAKKLIAYRRNQY